MRRTIPISITLIVGICLVAGLWILWLGEAPHSIRRDAIQPRTPANLSAHDFQTSEDAQLMEWLEKADQNYFTKEVDAFLVQPLSDDVRTRMLTLEGVEVTSGQFAELHALVTHCARILHLEKVPRVFVTERTQFPAVVENYSEPVVILQSSILDCFKQPTELRFLIGRELGHVKAGHTRWHTLVRRTKTFADRFSFLGDATTCAPLFCAGLASVK
jgi:Zn-dependent protease with chaperone function